MKIIARYKYTKGYSDVYPLEYVYYITATDYKTLINIGEE